MQQTYRVCIILPIGVLCTPPFLMHLTAAEASAHPASQDPIPEIAKLLMDSQRDSGSREAACGIVYTLKRESAEEVAAALRSRGAKSEDLPRAARDC